MGAIIEDGVRTGQIPRGGRRRAANGGGGRKSGSGNGHRFADGVRWAWRHGHPARDRCVRIGRKGLPMSLAKQGSKGRAAAGALVEGLETRRMLSSTLTAKGTLVVEGAS